jgi:alpha-mannosidase
MSNQELAQLKQNLGLLEAERKHFAERFFVQVEFARELALLPGQKAAGWDKLIGQALTLVGDCLTSRKFDELLKTIEKAEGILAPIGKVAKTYTVHCVGHAHIDMNWMWSWPETVAVTNDTFTTVLKLMEEFPEFCFTQSQASVYAIMLEYNPDLFGQIKKRIAEGRWEVAASHWVEGDKNLASGESLGRHLLYTRKFMKENFNLNPEDILIDWSPDTFGHAHTIPAIDSRGGVRHYYMCRGGRAEKPPVFWWQSPDGSRILVNLETTWYINQIASDAQTIGPWKPAALALVDFCKKTGIKDWMCVYGIGDHGGGPTRRDLKRVIDMNTWPIYPNFKFATTKSYYPILEKQGDKWPVLDGELNYEFTGCYTSQSLIKKNNRFAENYLVEAEGIAALAWKVLGKKYPMDQLQQAWVDTLFSHFHDILPGSGVRATRDYNHGTFQRTAATTSMIKTLALREMAGKVDTTFAGIPQMPALSPEQESTALGAGPGRDSGWGEISKAGHVADGPRAYLAFNPLGKPREDVITVSVWDADTGVNPGDIHKKTFVVKTPEGKTIPAQKITAGDYWGHRFVDVAFPVSVGALGYSTCVVEEGEAKGYKGGVVCNDALDWERVTVHSYAMENEFLAVDFDPLTGGVIKLIDKTTGKNLADPENPLGILEYILERPGAMTSWLIHPPQERPCPVKVESFAKVLRGPHIGSVMAKLKIKDSTATVTYSLKAGDPKLEITITAVWVERGGATIGTPALRMQFPLSLTDAKARYEIPFGSVERDLNKGEEVPALRWADVTGKIKGSANPAGCAVLNDSKYGHSLDGSTLRVNLIRSSYDPDILPEIGEHTIRLAVVPHGKALAVSSLVHLGAGLNHPLSIVGTGIHKGTLPNQASAVKAISSDNVVLSSVKKAEDDEAFVFRFFETAGKPATVKVELDTDFLGTPKQGEEVDFLERPTGKSAGNVKVARDGFTVKIPAFGIAGVKVRFS